MCPTLLSKRLPRAGGEPVVLGAISHTRVLYTSYCITRYGAYHNAPGAYLKNCYRPACYPVRHIAYWYAPWLLLVSQWVAGGIFRPGPRLAVHPRDKKIDIVGGLPHSTRRTGEATLRRYDFDCDKLFGSCGSRFGVGNLVAAAGGQELI